MIFFDKEEILGTYYDLTIFFVNCTSFFLVRKKLLTHFTIRQGFQGTVCYTLRFDKFFFSRFKMFFGKEEILDNFYDLKRFSEDCLLLLN